MEAGAQIVCTQELFRSQHLCQSGTTPTFKLAETIPGASTDALCEFAKANEVVVVGSLFERRRRSLSQHCGHHRCGRSLMGIYRKMAIPDDQAFPRSSTSRRRHTGFRAWKTRYATIGVLGVLGPVVSGSRTSDGAARRVPILFIHRHWMATRPRRSSSASAARIVGVYSAQPCSR